MDNKADKIWKKTLRDQQKRLKPGECMKFIRLVVDENITRNTLGQELLEELNKAQFKYEIRKLPECHCIIWERSVGQRALVINEESLANNNLSVLWEKENQVIKLLTVAELQKTIKNNGIGILVSRLRIAFPEMLYTFAVPKLKEKGDNLLNGLIEMQVVHGVNVRELTEGKEDLLCLLRCFTKSIAEAPYKQQRNEKLFSFKKYLANDKKQCVRVEGRNGFGRLWQQHLNRLPMVTLEVAESIIAQYSCPKKLLDAYDECSSKDGANLLADVKIQRGGPQPLQNDRRIGNVLSQKFHTLYTARDPNTLI